MTEIPISNDSDFIILSIKPHELTPQEQEIRRVSREATGIALNNLKKSTTLKDWLTWQRAASYSFAENVISWAWEYGGYTPESLVDDITSERMAKEYEKDAKIAEELAVKISTTTPQPDTFRIALKRARNPHGYYTYRALVAFPQGIHAVDPGDVLIPHEHSETEMIYYKPQNACTEHACDDLFKEHRGEIFYVPYTDLFTAVQKLRSDQKGMTEYLLAKTDGKPVKQDSVNYMLVAVLGGFSNENYYVRASDFWSRTK